jgi:hypothetical protein
MYITLVFNYKSVLNVIKKFCCCFFLFNENNDIDRLIDKHKIIELFKV